MVRGFPELARAAVDAVWHAQPALRRSETVSRLMHEAAMHALGGAFVLSDDHAARVMLAALEPFADEADMVPGTCPLETRLSVLSGCALTVGQLRAARNAHALAVAAGLAAEERT